MATHQFFATTAKGMESLLELEVKEAGGESVAVTRAGVAFQGSLEAAYRLCLWSRIANRVLLPLNRFPASNPEKLYGGVKAIRWSDHIGKGDETTIAVDFSASQSQITHTHFAALKVKDAIVDQLRSVRGARPSIDVMRPDVRINVYLLKDEATVSIDLSGDSLHKRGYRDDGAFAPLKENLAAGILMNTGWKEAVRSGNCADFSLLDPMCGSGTLPLEAAQMAADIAPGLGKEYYGFQKWLGHVPAVWNRLVAEAEERRVRDRKKLPRIVGYDADFRVVRAAIANVERAGLRQNIHIEKRELSACERISERGIFVVNPPYGERLGEVEELRGLYKEIGDTMKKKFQGWEGYVFTGSPELAKEVGLKPSRKIVLFNGAIECRLFRYELFGGRAADRKAAPTKTT
ncbi:MAG: THUMP domain-containing protein [Oligoflexia bacterium]|nr:THUMP domain-containing protein [Oligoflexia bacterium]